MEGFEVPWNLRLVDEESCKKHEWDDKHGSKGYCKLLVRNTARNNQRVARARIVNKNEDS